jgi:hypothetical protein
MAGAPDVKEAIDIASIKKNQWFEGQHGSRAGIASKPFDLCGNGSVSENVVHSGTPPPLILGWKQTGRDERLPLPEINKARYSARK